MAQIFFVPLLLYVISPVYPNNSAAYSLEKRLALLSSIKCERFELLLVRLLRYPRSELNLADLIFLAILALPALLRLAVRLLSFNIALGFS